MAGSNLFHLARRADRVDKGRVPNKLLDTLPSLCLGFQGFRARSFAEDALRVFLFGPQDLPGPAADAEMGSKVQSEVESDL